MARPLRIEFEGAWYHVMNRGAGRKAIFRNDADRRYFLKLLQEISDRFAVEMHAYCLMDNHYHLMVHTPERGIGSGLVLTHFWSRLMTWLVPFVSNSQVPSIM